MSTVNNYLVTFTEVSTMGFTAKATWPVGSGSYAMNRGEVDTYWYVRQDGATYSAYTNKRYPRYQDLEATTTTSTTSTTTTPAPSTMFGKSTSTYATVGLACAGTVTGTVYQDPASGTTPTSGQQLYTDSGRTVTWTPPSTSGYYLFQYGSTSKWAVSVSSGGVITGVTSCYYSAVIGYDASSVTTACSLTNSIGVTGNDTDFCNSTSFTSAAGFSMATGNYYLSDGTNYIQCSHTTSTNLFTRISFGCTTCPGTTTTTTTTTAGPCQVLLSPSNIDGATACDNWNNVIDRTTYYALYSGCSATNGQQLYTDSGLTTLLPNGWYSDGTNYWLVAGGAGTLNSQTACAGTTTTTTTTTTAAPLNSVTYGYHLSDPDQACTNYETNVHVTKYNAGNAASANGITIYNNSNGSGTPTDGYYARGSNVWYSTSGVLGSEAACYAGTTTTTTTTTTTAAPTTTTTTAAPVEFSVSLSTSSGGVCSMTTIRTVKSSNNDISLSDASINGAALYRMPQNTLITGYTYVAETSGGSIDSETFNINSSTGVVGSGTGNFC